MRFWAKAPRNNCRFDLSRILNEFYRIIVLIIGNLYCTNSINIYYVFIEKFAAKAYKIKYNDENVIVNTLIFFRYQRTARGPSIWDADASNKY